MLLEEYRYVAKEKKTSKFIPDNIEISSNDSDRENSDEEDTNLVSQIDSKVEVNWYYNEIYHGKGPWAERYKEES